MASDHDNYVFLNEENEEIDYVRDTPYIRQMLDIPEVEINTDGQDVDCEVTEVLETPVEEISENVSESEEHWDENKVKQLLNMYLENIDKFRNPRVKKKLLWRKIAAVVGKDADTCDKKFRNLKQHYVNLLRKKHNNRGAIRWPFFGIFEQISNKGGIKVGDTKYRPIAMKPEWGQPVLVVSSAPTVENPAIVNLAANAGINSISIPDLTDMGPQKKRKVEEFQSINEELRERQKNIELKLDRLVEVVEESNDIQRERNKLFQDYLKKLNK